MIQSTLGGRSFTVDSDSTVHTAYLLKSVTVSKE